MLVPIELWMLIVGPILCLIIGGIVGFVICRKLFQKQLKENPPINEKQIRAMFRSMGKTPSEKQIREIMRNVNSQR